MVLPPAACVKIHRCEGSNVGPPSALLSPPDSTQHRALALLLQIIRECSPSSFASHVPLRPDWHTITPTPAPKAPDRATSEFWRRPLAQVLQECNAKPSQSIKLSGAKGAIELNKCYRGREHLSCIIAALLTEANSIKQDYADIVSADYPNLKTLDSICQITPDRLAEHSKALQTFRERWALLRK
jgi:hypothetical protein